MASTKPLPDVVAHCVELLSPLGHVRVNRMFGGFGLYVDEIFIAIVAYERLYLKADDANRQAFKDAGCEPFSYVMKGEMREMSGYWTAPADAMESPALMLPWARGALQAALAARAARPAPALRRREPAPKTAAAKKKTTSAKAPRARKGG